jgi:hypothetical protein
MNCRISVDLQQKLELVRRQQNHKPTQELAQKEDELCVAIKDHKMIHNTGWLESDCGPA